MSKKYKDKICVYCGKRTSETGDHVIAREFIPDEKRTKPIIVPACIICNNNKSKLEHYLTTVLPFGSQASGAKEMLKKMIPPRLDKNIKLKKALSSGIQHIFIESKEEVNFVPTLTVPFDGTKLKELFNMIIRGLTFHHWKVIIPGDYTVVVLSSTLEGIIEFRNRIVSTFLRSNMVQGNIGDGCFIYMGVRHSDDACVSAWEMNFYNAILTNTEQKVTGAIYFYGFSYLEPVKC